MPVRLPSQRARTATGCGLVLLVVAGIFTLIDARPNRWLARANATASTPEQRPFRIQGQVRGLRSPGDLTIVLTSPSRAVADQVQTTADGRFSARVAVPGEYSLEVRTRQFLPSTRRLCTVTRDPTTCELDLPDTRIDLSVISKTDPRAVGIYISGPVSPTDSHAAGFVTTSEAKAFSLSGLGFGTYSIVAYSRDGRTSVAPVSLELTPASPSAVGQLELAQRSLRVRVQNSEGDPITSAMVRSPLRPLDGDNGLFNADTIPNGMPLQVQALGYVPTCQYAGSEAVQQTVVLDRMSVLRTYITLRPYHERPRGIIDGVPGSQCGVDVKGFRLDQSIDSPLSALRFGVVGLPRGSYLYKAAMGAPQVRLEVPGDGIDYQVPAECLVCR